MTEQLETEHRSDSINLSAVAAGKVKSLLEQEGRDDLSLRISVQPGGCSGFKYTLNIEEKPEADDIVIESSGVRLFVEVGPSDGSNHAREPATVVRVPVREAHGFDGREPDAEPTRVLQPDLGGGSDVEED